MKTKLLTMLLFGQYVVVQAQIEFIAHRGASYLAPENTVAAAKLAWGLGADAVEVDVRLSGDKMVMVIHDSNTKRTTGIDYEVSETPSYILRQLDAGSYKGEKFKGEKIPFLEEIIDIIPPDKKLVVELKSQFIPQLKKVVDKSNKSNQLVFICFDWETILEMGKVFPDNGCYWLCNNENELKKRRNDIVNSKLKGVVLKYPIINKEVMDWAGRYNLDIIAYGVNTLEEAKRLIMLGAKKITTDRIGWLKKQLAISVSDTIKIHR